ncbi:chromosome condensation protein CrcB [Alteribacter lacisalsi]|uniref:Fluoride-specific ion channel FluC n=1 Tax=Alteribacter lacisalsi TaxID=2045244 RepID=A0A2W0HQ54_9BACI|nr:CrcB family protein [Alteribacter lacisalsi]PYZ98989.1 chromosome condensation protein CrcB [Alteribacter lacisalsi]
MKISWYLAGAIFIGGALGTIVRYLINVQTMFTLYPIGTLIENIAGSFLLGALTRYVLHRKPREVWKAGLGVGFCGSLTTMSTLAADAFMLAGENSITASALYIGMSLSGGLLVALAGFMMADKLGKKKEAVTGD